MRRLAIIIAATVLLSGCGDTWLGDNAPPPLPGKRISVLGRGEAVSIDVEDSEKVVLPAPERVRDWPQAGGFAPHAMHHLEISDNPREVWSVSVGYGGDRRRVLMAQPIVANGVVFAMDSWANVSAFSLENGKKIWSVDLTPEDVFDGTYGGGVSYDDGKIFVTTGFNQLIALSADNGREAWRIDLPATVRGAPTARAGRVLTISIENQTVAYSAEDGRRLWSHSGLAEEAAMVGGGSAAVDGNTVIVTYSSGEVFALRIENGAPIWGDMLTGGTRTDQVATMADIRGLPVVWGDKVFVASNNDTIVAIDLRSGRRAWTRDVGSIDTPWVAGNYLYALSNNTEIVCFEAETGRVLWATPLQEWRNEGEKRGKIIWNRPLLASDRLIVASAEGDVLALSPYTGEVLGRLDISERVTIAPIVADGTLIILTESGELVAYR